MKNIMPKVFRPYTTPLLRTLTALALLAVLSLAHAANAKDSRRHMPMPHTLPKETADEFAKLLILHDGRLCLMETFAYDFVRNVYGSYDYKGLTPPQVLTGWIFWGEEWMQEPMLRHKGGCVTAQAIDRQSTQASQLIRHDTTLVAKRAMIMSLRRGLALKMFPYNNGKDAPTWYAPTEDLPEDMVFITQTFIQTVFTDLYDYANSNDYTSFSATLKRIADYQGQTAQGFLPQTRQLEAEHWYNVNCKRIEFDTTYKIIWYVLFALLIALTARSVAVSIRQRHHAPRRRPAARHKDVWMRAAVAIVALAALAVCCIVEYHIYILNGNALPLGSHAYVTWHIMSLALLLSAIAATRSLTAANIGLLVAMVCMYLTFTL